MPAILIVAPHPDDEAFGCAGTVARYAEQGVASHLLTLTKGQIGTMSDGVDSPEALGLLREYETRASARVIGAASVELLDYMDGALDQVPLDEVAGHVSRKLVETGADTIITFGPTGLTRHVDHIAGHKAAMRAAESAAGGPRPVRVLWVAIDGPFADQLEIVGPEREPTHRIDVTDYLDVKLAALACHSSQQDSREFFAMLSKFTTHEELYHQALPVVPSGALFRDLFQG
ncbi:MAG: PIG-L deacetylase family protein [Dehalococcoidia bacterium]